MYRSTSLAHGPAVMLVGSMLLAFGAAQYLGRAIVVVGKFRSPKERRPLRQCQRLGDQELPSLARSFRPVAALLGVLCFWTATRR